MSSARHKSAAARAVHKLIHRAAHRAIQGAVFAVWMGLLGWSGAARADDDTDTFTVTATVLASCEISANDLAFGDYDPIAASNLDAATTLSVTCTNGTPYNVALDLGGGAGASTATRYMVSGGDALGYALYRNAGRTQLWGETIGNDTLAGVGAGTSASIDVYGRIPMQQAAPSGDYQDTIIVTVTW